MREADVFELADHALRDVVERIKDDQWEREVPDAMRWRAGTRVLRDVVNHHAYDDIWVPDVLAGRTPAEVGDRYEGDLLGDDPRRSFARIVDTAVAAVREFEDLDKIVHLSYGDFPARVYLLHITIFRGFGAYDIARFAGMDTELPAPLVRGLWDMIEPEADELRAIGVFGPKITVPDDASPQDRLLALSGRDPSR
ncbi:MAG TPA: TIGR03086 family metal-binding protein [Actinophytocola sp.]|uniref:TIGR03086 family metal-binding protein n=1 Tax=Actinophytocola sp. TaxID=1872138 RepID=UPI002DDD952F|nr:TIGR03086 family metal-binding protein [Actinophytocola sp.]HEV2783829.1 TIGR03086 family metal-binding protein [Actinophytocola sp.]